MLNRRLIRVKVFQAYYAAETDKEDKLALRKAESFLMHSLEGIEEAFFAAVLFPYDLKHFMEQEFGADDQPHNRQSERKKAARLLSSMSFWQRLEQTPAIRERIDKPRYNWSQDAAFLRLMLKALLQEDFFIAAIENEQVSDEYDFMLNMYDFFLLKNEDFMQQFEGMHMYWEDERTPVMQSIKKLLKNKGEVSLEIPELSPDWEDDSSFAKALLRCAIENEEAYTKIIASFTPDWETDRMARTDMLIMVMAMCEFLQFPYIPVKVSLNEYLELAKRYSTPQSSKFVNGVLDKLLKKLQQENKVIKKGRGLLE